jgi:polyhydroxyalkanoate synthesis regulator phasin
MLGQAPPPSTGSGSGSAGQDNGATVQLVDTGGANDTPVPGSELAQSGNLTIPADADTYDKLIQTLGANGTTTVLSDTLESYAKELLAAGEITQEQANLFNQLANQGHRMAAIEKALENAIETGAEKVTFDGKTDYVFEFSQVIGWKGGAGIQPNLLEPLLVSEQSPEMKVFTDQYRALLNSGALDNPAIRERTHQLAIDIANLSENLEASMIDYEKGSASKGNLRDIMASKLTNEKSAVICGTGGGVDSGTHCP